MLFDCVWRKVATASAVTSAAAPDVAVASNLTISAWAPYGISTDGETFSYIGTGTAGDTLIQAYESDAYTNFAGETVSTALATGN